MSYENSTNKIWGQRTDGLKWPSASFPLLLVPYSFHFPYFLIAVAGGQVGIHRSPLPLTEGEDPLEKQERICEVWVALNCVTVSLFLAGN